jgi:hypothetical protein
MACTCLVLVSYLSCTRGVLAYPRNGRFPHVFDPLPSESISIAYSMALLAELFPEAYYPENSKELAG